MMELLGAITLLALVAWMWHRRPFVNDLGTLSQEWVYARWLRDHGNVSRGWWK
jgi:hypothetical protein